MAAHLLHQSAVDCNAFLGGISKNYGTNYILSPTSDYVRKRPTSARKPGIWKWTPSSRASAEPEGFSR